MDFLINKIIDNFFFGNTIEEIWNSCPNKMLWEAIDANCAVAISHADICSLLENSDSVIVFPEPLPALYLGASPAFVSFQSCNDNMLKETRLWKVEPIYLASATLSWLIAMTPENTLSGSQLCVMVKNINN